MKKYSFKDVWMFTYCAAMMRVIGVLNGVLCGWTDRFLFRGHYSRCYRVMVLEYYRCEGTPNFLSRLLAWYRADVCEDFTWWRQGAK